MLGTLTFSKKKIKYKTKKKKKKQKKTNEKEVRDCLDLFGFTLHGSGNRGHGYSVIVQEQISFLKQVEITKNLKHN